MNRDWCGEGLGDPNTRLLEPEHCFANRALKLLGRKACVAGKNFKRAGVASSHETMTAPALHVQKRAPRCSMHPFGTTFRYEVGTVM